MASWTGKTRGNLLGYKLFVLILRYLGLGVAYFVLRFVALYFFLFVPRSFRILYDFFHQKLEQAPLRATVNVYRNFYKFGQVILDKFAVMGGLKDKYTYDFDGEEYLLELVEEKKGGILISAHIGNWDVAGSLLNRLGSKIHIVIFDGEHEKIKQFTAGNLEQGLVNFIPIKQDFSHLFQMNKALKEKELICIHGDRFLPGAKVTERQFLNHPADFPLGPFELAARFKVPCVFVFAMRAKKRHYFLSATPPKVYTNGPEPIVDDFVKAMEEKVYQYPLQWFNHYPFWKT